MIANYGFPNTFGMAGYNELARRCSWPVLCDDRCEFRDPQLSEIHAIWCDRAGPSGIPGRREMTARALKPYLKLVTFHELVVAADGTRRFRVRLMGRVTSDVVGEGSGKFYDEFLSKEALPRWNATSEAVLSQGSPLRFLMRADDVEKGHIVGEVFGAPLLTDEGRPEMLITAAHFSPISQWEDTEALRKLDAHLAGLAAP